MTGLKSGSGDDLWGDDGSDDGTDGDGAEYDNADDESAEDADADVDAGRDAGADVDADAGSDAGTRPDDGGSTDGQGTASTSADAEDSGPTLDPSSAGSQPSSDSQPYIVRRAVQDKSVQFERDERLTFFVHDDVADGERDLITDLESALGRDVPKFDVREAVYRAALRNPDDVLDELLQMGYSVDEE